MARKKPWHMRSKGPAQTAYYLILQCDNDVGKAHKYVTRVGRLLKKGRGRPPAGDTTLRLLIADAIRRHGRYRDRKIPLQRAAKEGTTTAKSAAANLKRMQRRLGKRRLTDFVEEFTANKFPKEFAEGKLFGAMRRPAQPFVGPRDRVAAADIPIFLNEGYRFTFGFRDKNPRKSD